MASTNPSSFSLKPVTEDDIPALAEISGLAFEKDRHTMLKAAHPTNPYDHAGGTPAMLKYYLSLPEKIELTKAVDNETGEVLGWVGWATRKPDPTQPAAMQGQKEVDKKTATATATKGPPGSVSQNYEMDTSSDLDALAQLSEITSSHFADFQRRMMPPGTRCMFVAGVNVHPKHQGRGIGRAFIRHGTERADADGVFCWVHASEAGAPAFLKCGFEVDDTLVLDLDKWAGQMDPPIRPPVGEENWGTYTFRYCVRQPLTG